MGKKDLSEADICAKFITPAIVSSGWDERQLRREVTFTAGRIIVRGKLHTRGKRKRADYILSYKPNLPLAVVEAKDNKHSVGAGMQQALVYAKTLDIPFVYASNGDAFIEHDQHDRLTCTEREIPLDQFPSPEELWNRYRKSTEVTPEVEQTVTQPYYTDASGKKPRYYQRIAINRTIDAIARGENRVLLVMATGTGKTYTAFQIIWRLWKSGRKKRVLFLADRNILVDQTKTNDLSRILLEDNLAIDPVKRTPAPTKQVNKEAARVASEATLPPKQCSKCQSDAVSVQYGKYGYYLKCADCDGNTRIKYFCKQCGESTKIRKQKLNFFARCKACGTEELYHTNNVEGPLR